MSNLMDPDGTNRILKRQIDEWYSERDAARNASLLGRGANHKSWSPIEAVRDLLKSIVMRGSAIRHRQPTQPAPPTVRPADPASRVVEGPLS